MDWHEISECAIKYATIRPGSKNSKIATCPLLLSFKPSNLVFERADGAAGRGGVPTVCVRRPYRGPGDAECQRVSHFCGVERGARGL